MNVVKLDPPHVSQLLEIMPEPHLRCDNRGSVLVTPKLFHAGNMRDRLHPFRALALHTATHSCNQRDCIAPHAAARTVTSVQLLVVPSLHQPETLHCWLLSLAGRTCASIEAPVQRGAPCLPCALSKHWLLGHSERNVVEFTWGISLCHPRATGRDTTLTQV